MIKPKLIQQFLVEPGSEVDLKRYPTDWTDTDAAQELGKDVIKERAHEILEETRKQLSDAQELLYASDTHSVLLIFQAMDAAGKDGTIRHVMSGVNPQGCQVYSFKKPSAEELDHNFLWRYMKALPERGRIGIFNRSYYEDVLVVKVHPEWLGPGQPAKPDDKFWEQRYEDINNFEKHLARNGTLVLKFFLHVSKGEQKRRFLERLNNPDKHWKFSEADMAERAHWKEYQEAFEEMIRETSTHHAPWHVIPADRKWFARVAVASILLEVLQDIAPRHPEVTDAQRRALKDIRKQLVATESEPAAKGRKSKE